MHYSVLLNEIVSIITPQYGGTFIDCTFGQGGYSSKILEFSNTKIIALDRDKDTLKKVKTLLSCLMDQKRKVIVLTLKLIGIKVKAKIKKKRL